MDDTVNGFIFIIIAAIVVFVILLLYLYIIRPFYLVRVDNVIRYFLLSIRTIHNFSEDDAEMLMAKFDYSRRLFCMEFDRKINWETDPNLFIQSCITTMNMLSYYADKESIYYQDDHLFDAIRFSLRMMYSKIRYNSANIHKFNNSYIYDVYTALLISMHTLCLKEGHKLNGIDYHSYINHYKKLYTSTTLYNMHTSDTDDDDILFMNYHKYIILCRNFLHTIKL